MSKQAKTKKQKEVRRVQFGMAPVDSGMLLIADPCYLRDFGEITYQNFCEDLKGSHEEVSLPSGGLANGLLFSPGGDGCFVIYGEYEDMNPKLPKGRLARVVIDILGDLRRTKG